MPSASFLLYSKVSTFEFVKYVLSLYSVCSKLFDLYMNPIHVLISGYTHSIEEIISKGPPGGSVVAVIRSTKDLVGCAPVTREGRVVAS